MDNVESIRRQLVVKYQTNEFVIDKSGVKTLELVGTSFIADEPAIFGEPNAEYIARELEWYQSQSLNVNDIPGVTPKIWKEVASPEGLINSNYGYLVASYKNGDQYENVLSELLINPNSRRAVMIYTRPTMHTDYNKDGMSDFVCTNTVQYLIRSGKMHAVVQMRSNDLIFGYANDYAWQQYMLNVLINDYNSFNGVDPVLKGDITWQVGSLHLYERHFNYIEYYNYNK